MPHGSCLLSLMHISMFFPLLSSFFVIGSGILNLSPSSLLFFFSNQGSEKGWSDYCRTAEEDCEQPESPGVPQQEWPSTCLKQIYPTNRNQRPNFWSVLINCGCCLHSHNADSNWNWRKTQQE